MEQPITVENKDEKFVEADNPTAKDHTRIKTYVMECMDLFISQRTELEKKWREAEKMAHGKSIGSYVRTQSKVSVPKIHDAIRSVSSRLRDVLWGGEDNFDLYSEMRVLGEEAEVIKTYMNNQTRHIGREMSTFYSKFEAFTHCICVYGKAFMRISWEFTQGKKSRIIWKPRPKRDKFGQLKGLDYRRTEVELDTTLYDGLSVEVRTPLRVFANALITDIARQPIIVESMDCDWNYLQENYKAGVFPFLKDEYKELTTDPNTYSRRNYTRTAIQTDKGIINQQGRNPSKNYELLQAYFWDYNGDGKYKIATFIVGDNESHVLQFDDLGYCNDMGCWIDANFETDLHSFYSPGIPELCREMQIDFNDNRRQIRDFATFTLNCMWLWDATSGVAPEYLFSEANKVIPTHSYPGISPLRPDPAALGIGLASEKLSAESIGETSMAPPSFQGMPTRYGTTATETSQMLTQAGISIIDVAKHIEDRCINRILRMIYLFDRQFIIKEQVVIVMGQDGLKFPKSLNPWELKEDINFVATGSLHMQNRMIKAQSLINLLNISDKLGDKIKVQNIIADLLKLWDFNNASRYINLDKIEDLVDPADENLLLLQGQEVVVKAGDNHMEHMTIHAQAFKQSADEKIKQNILDHKDEHEKVYIRQTKEKEMAMAMAGGIGDKVAGKGSETPGSNHMPSTAIGINRQTQKKGVPRAKTTGGGEI